MIRLGTRTKQGNRYKNYWFPFRLLYTKTKQSIARTGEGKMHNKRCKHRTRVLYNSISRRYRAWDK
jgi:hypothetical protein